MLIISVVRSCWTNSIKQASGCWSLVCGLVTEERGGGLGVLQSQILKTDSKEKEIPHGFKFTKAGWWSWGWASGVSRSSRRCRRLRRKGE